MNNKGFEIKLNGELLTRAGLQNNHGIVTCIVNAVLRKEEKKQSLELHVSGLNSDENQHIKWTKLTELKENDIVSVKIVAGNFDEPKEKSKKRSDKYLLEQKIKTYHKLKEELKDHIK
ncbi:hypothetical protein EYD45_11975 [Hyunsoonleella flava]|uniref:Uncharacterized protein n=1 Tax=Hyunsoonleella flava TaxID=2527939 RepID=A0A4V2J9Y5_9FLAO|nr:hypothetical protein [Hyunsoonleella flava]TBN02420.1 hypothetical protein EYD45_11975 [Hyunsoonleella flava]